MRSISFPRAALRSWLLGSAGALLLASPALGQLDVGERLGELSRQPDAPRALLEALAEGELPGDPPIALDDSGAARCVDALVLQPRLELLELLAELARDSASAAHRGAGLKVLGRLGTSRELELCFELADLEPLPPPTLLASFQAALVDLHQRSPSLPSELLQPLLEARGVLQDGCLAALAESPSREVLDLYLAALGRGSTSLEVALLARIGELWERRPAWFDALQAEPVRERISHGLDAVSREAMLALGRGADSSATVALVEQLGSTSSVRVSAAHWALRRVTALDLNARRETWEAWLRSSLLWREQDKRTAVADLGSSNRTLVCQALREIAEQCLDRDELAHEVLRVLERRDPDTFYLACATLRSLRSTAVLPELVDLFDSEPELREPLHLTLLHLTGARCEPSADAWRSLLDLHD